jgi:hypothetical protein
MDEEGDQGVIMCHNNTENALQSGKLLLPRIMHVNAHLLNNISNTGVRK